MPKPFMIGVEIEETAFGAVMRRIDALEGVIKIYLNLNKEKGGKANGHDVPRITRARRPAKQFEITGAELVTKALFSKSPLTTAQLREAFISQDRAPSSINSVIHTMIKENEIKPTKDGYVLTKLARDRVRHRVTAKKSRR